MRYLALIAILILLGLGRSTVVAQDATPVSGDCTIDPRPVEEVRALAERAATPFAGSAQGAVRLPAGEPVDEETIAQLLAILNGADACSEAQDVFRFLAHYSDEFIIRYILADEPAGIAPGQQPPGVNPAGTPAPEPVTVIDAAVLLDDGTIAAHIFETGVSDFGTIVFFVPEGDRWLIDDIANSADPPSGRAEVPAGAEGIVAAVIDDAATTLGVSPETVTVATIKASDWPNAALGCPEEGGVYAEVVTPGYRIVVTDGSASLTYHTDLQGAIVNCTPE
jgi:hypothetical protein